MGTFVDGPSAEESCAPSAERVDPIVWTTANETERHQSPTGTVRRVESTANACFYPGAQRESWIRNGADGVSLM